MKRWLCWLLGHRWIASYGHERRIDWCERCDLEKHYDPYDDDSPPYEVA